MIAYIWLTNKLAVPHCVEYHSVPFVLNLFTGRKLKSISCINIDEYHSISSSQFANSIVHKNPISPYTFTLDGVRVCFRRFVNEIKAFDSLENIATPKKT